MSLVTVNGWGLHPNYEVMFLRVCIIQMIGDVLFVAQLRYQPHFGKTHCGLETPNSDSHVDFAEYTGCTGSLACMVSAHATMTINQFSTWSYDCVHVAR